ncbi:carbohydrate-binding module family 50 protein [Chiua virens]|nr:carbohydrate-binding module family 50 protein [Chiua virens]
MGRWTQYDEDDYRLPEGVKRIGYDTDTGCYYFRDREGLVYKGPEGSQFGELTQVADLPVTVSAEGDDDDVEAASARADGYEPLSIDEHGSRHVLRGGAYRTLFPFFLIVAVTLLLIWRLAFSPTIAAPAPCPSTTISYIIQPGDTCWDLTRRYNSTLDKFQIVNPKVVCSDLHPGERVCIPDEGSSISRVF